MSYDHLSFPYLMQVAADCLTGSFTEKMPDFPKDFVRWVVHFPLRFPILSHGCSEISRIFPWMAPHDLWAPGWWKMAGPTATTPCGSCTKTWWPLLPGKGASSQWNFGWGDVQPWKLGDEPLKIVVNGDSWWLMVVNSGDKWKYMIIVVNGEFWRMKGWTLLKIVVTSGDSNSFLAMNGLDWWCLKGIKWYKQQWF